VYKKQALIPARPWMDNKAPAAPAVTSTLQNDARTISWTHPDTQDVSHWVVYSIYGTTWSYQILNRNDRSIKLNSTGIARQSLNTVIVTAVDRTGNESEKKEVEIK